MAKPATIQIKLVSTADTGVYYVTKKNPRTKPEKLELKKYDPKVRKHVIFKEAKKRILQVKKLRTNNIKLDIKKVANKRNIENLL